MLPGTRYTAGKILGILFKRSWLIVGLVAGSTLAAKALAPRIPELVRADQLLIGAIAVAAVVSVALVVLMEFRDRSFRREHDVTRVLSLPVLAAVPLMTTRIERQARRRHLAVTLVSVFVLASSAVMAVVWWRMQL